MQNYQQYDFECGKIIRTFSIVIFLLISNVVFLKTCMAAGSGDQVLAAGPSDNANSVLSAIYKVVQHGDLADARFFTEIFGIGMNQLPDKKALFGFEVCGVPEDPDLVETSPVKLRRFQYVNVPSFLKKPVEHLNSCSADYVERLDDKGQVSKVMAKLEFDMNGACITESDIVAKLPDAMRDPRSTPNMFLYSYHGKNGVNINFISLQNKNLSKCIGVAVLTQEILKDDK